MKLGFISRPCAFHARSASPFASLLLRGFGCYAADGRHAATDDGGLAALVVGHGRSGMAGLAECSLEALEVLEDQARWGAPKISVPVDRLD